MIILSIQYKVQILYPFTSNCLPLSDEASDFTLPKLSIVLLLESNGMHMPHMKLLKYRKRF